MIPGMNVVLTPLQGGELLKATCVHKLYRNISSKLVCMGTAVEMISDHLPPTLSPHTLLALLTLSWNYLTHLL